MHTLDEAIRNTPILAAISRGRPRETLTVSELEQMVLALSTQNSVLLEHVARLEAIAPRRFVLPDGTSMTFRAPDEIIPIWNLPMPASTGN